MLMQRFFVPAELMSADMVYIEGEDARQLQRVLRAEIGYEMIVSNGVDRDVLAKIIELGKDRVVARIIKELPRSHEPKFQVTIAQSMPKTDKMELVIQKGTELGAFEFLPFSSKRTVVHYDAKKEAKRLERWHKISKEAAEQAHRNLVPGVHSPVHWKALLHKLGDYDMALLCFEKSEGSLPLKKALRSLQETTVNEPQRILLMIGPEGGFTDDEVQQVKQGGGKLVTLGPRILRTETAAMAALSCILYEYNEMEG